MPGDRVQGLGGARRIVCKRVVGVGLGRINRAKPCIRANRQFPLSLDRSAGLETRDTADMEVCATSSGCLDCAVKVGKACLSSYIEAG